MKKKTFKEKAQDLKPDRNDVGNAMVSGSLGSLPVVGPVAATLWDLISTSLERRQKEFFIEIAEAVDELQNAGATGASFEELKEDENFQITLMKVMQIVTRTKSNEKKRVLKNVIVNSIAKPSEGEDEVEMFLNYIDDFSESHILLLKFYNNSENFSLSKQKVNSFTMGGALSTLIESEFNFSREFYEQLTRDLYNYGLIRVNVDNLHTTMTGSGLLSSRTTSMGERFIDFISRDDN